jgi:predicted amidophosphoribosyltransferase
MLVKSYKFGGARRVGHFYVECLKKGREALGCGKEAVWVPVPPRPGKIKKTGWDQIEHLARLMAGSYKIPVSRCLKRLPSISQKELDREQRRTNLKGRILTVSEAPETVILFDDIYTTGSTLDACAQALKNGGSRRVYGVCLYYDL